MRLHYKDPEVSRLARLNRDKGDAAVYTGKSLNTNLIVFRKRKTGMIGFDALPTLKLDHGGNTAASLPNLKRRLPRTAARHDLTLGNAFR